MSLAVLDFPGPSSVDERCLMILLPGADMTARDFETHHFIDCVRKLRQPIDIVCINASVDAYLDNTIAEDLHALVTRAIDQNPARRLWFAGISLGAMGALLYAKSHPGLTEGIILLSPFIGSRGLIDEVEQSGGLRQWAGLPDDAPLADRELLRWLGRYPGDGTCPRLYLGYGRSDRFAGAHRMLGGTLPDDQVIVLDGCHDWPTWEALWAAFMATNPLAECRV